VRSYAQVFAINVDGRCCLSIPKAKHADEAIVGQAQHQVERGSKPFGVEKVFDYAGWPNQSRQLRILAPDLLVGHADGRRQLISPVGGIFRLSRYRSH
jgi:hypothetical protein